MTPAQNALILRDLKRGKRITPMGALLDYGSLRLGARIFELRKKGHVIHSRRIPVGQNKWVAEYKMIRAAS